MQSLLLILLLAPAPGGFSLDDAWGDAWRRILDRHGRQDPEGPLQQRRLHREYPEYALDLDAARFPMAAEDAWRQRATGARLWVQSLNEFTLATVVQAKLRASLFGADAPGAPPAGPYLGLRVDRREDRDGQSDLIRFDLGWDAIADTPAYARLSLYPRWEKEDTDLELAVGLRHPDWGAAGLRLMALDPFTNAAYALARSRDAALARETRQRDAPLAFALELQSARIAGARLEAYAGVVLPATTRFTTAPRSPTPTLTERTDSGLLAGGLAEWRPAALPLALGLATLHVLTETHAQRATHEAFHRTWLYGLATLGAFDLEASAARTASGDTTDGIEVADRRWLLSLRSRWLPGPVGAELALSRSTRALGGAPAGRAAGTDHRLLTRFIFRLGQGIHGGLGVGWDLDPEDGRYDGGGFTLMMDL